MAPTIKVVLDRVQPREDAVPNHLQVQGAVEAFVLALRLRMVGPAVERSDAEADQPNGQRSERVALVAAPRWAVVHQHLLWPAVALERADQVLLHGDAALVSAGLEGQRVSRVVVE